MRLLTHNTLMNRSAEAKGKGFPLQIKAEQIRVDDPGEAPSEKQTEFVQGMLSTIDWPALVKAASELGISTLPTELTPELVNDPEFLAALYHVLMNVHLVEGTLTCPATGREFPVHDGIPNMMLEEDECEHVRY